VTEALTESTEVDPRSQRWGIPDAVLGWFAVVVASQVFTVLVLGATGHLEDDFEDLPLEVLALAQLGLALGFFLVPYLVTRIKGNGPVVDLGFRARWSDLWQGGLVGALLQFPVLVILYVPILRLLDKSTSDVEGPARSLSDRVDGPLGVVLLVLIVGVLAPVFEELFYRGLFQRSLLKHGLPPWLGIGLTSVVFGLSHLQPLQTPGLILAGAVFGWLAYRTGRLGTAIAAHVAFNMVTVVALLAS
jgi:membrane protease YdiL (CAAX protease family)